MKFLFTYLKGFFGSKENPEKENGIGTELHLVLNKLVDDAKIPGLAITVLRAGEVLFQKGYGYASLEDRTPVDPEMTIFRVASVSKNIAATALAIMVKEGLIDLDTSLYDYVPYFPKKEYDFSIRHLASHTSGIRGYRGKEYALNEPYSIKEGIAVFKNDDLLFEPGTDYLYTSYNWVLVSLAMQEAAGKPFETYVYEKVLLPLQMDQTFAEDHGLSDTNQQMAQFYSKNLLVFRKSVSVNNTYKLAGGGYLATSADLAKLGNAVLDRSIMDDDVLDQFLTSTIINGTSTYYGLGWQVSQDKKGRSFYGHVGNGVGGYANLFVYPNEQLVFSIVVNCTHPKVQEELDAVIDLIICDSQKTIV